MQASLAVALSRSDDAVNSREALLRHREGDPEAFGELVARYRRRRVRELIFGSPPPLREPRDLQPDAERAAAARERLSWLEGEIPALPLAQREVLLLAGVEGLALADVSAVLKMPVNTVKTHLRRARLELCRRLAERGDRP